MFKQEMNFVNQVMNSVFKNTSNKTIGQPFKMTNISDKIDTFSIMELNKDQLANYKLDVMLKNNPALQDE